MAPALLAALMLFSSGQRTSAQPGRQMDKGVVLKLSIAGVTNEVEALLKDALRGVLMREGFEMVPDAEVQEKLERDPELLECRTKSCFERATLTFGVRRMLIGEVQRHQRSSFAVRLAFRDLLTGAPLSDPQEDRCDICTTDEAREMLVRVAERLSRSAPPLAGAPGQGQTDTGMLHLMTQPLGVEVVLDGVLQRERAPASFLLGIGVHTLVLRAPGYRTVRRPVEISAGQNVTLAFELSPIAPRRPWLTALSVALTVGAVGLAGSAGTLLYYDGRPVHTAECPPLPMFHLCPEKYDHLLPGSLTAVGAGLLAVGAGLAFYFDHAPPRRRAVVPLSPSASPERR